MLLRSLHQFHATVAYGDAIGNDIFELQRLFWRRGMASEVFAQEAKPGVEPFVREWPELRDVATERAGLLVHLSMGNAAVADVTALPHRKAVVYHNITPARFFDGISEQLAHHADLGREQLRALAAVSDVGIADSEFNRKELEEAGYARTAVVPILTDPFAFDVSPDPAIAAELADERTSILVVGQILPQKAIHDVVEAFARYREIDPSARLYLVGPTGMSGPYLERIRERIGQLGIGDSVHLTGAVPIEQLVAYYRGATALLHLSDHEGFNVPLLEAMRSDLPIVAFAAGATPETLGDAGLLLERKAPEDVASALERAVRDGELRRTLVARGRARLAAFAPERVIERLERALGLAQWELPPPVRRSIAVVSSDERCGIHSYSLALCAGLRSNGQEVTFVGVARQDSADLGRKLGGIAKGDAVIVEHEAGLFRDVSFVRGLVSLWRRGHEVVLAMHELEPEKFHHYRVLTRALQYRASYPFALELVRAPWVALRLAWAFVRYRLVLALMGRMPTRLVVHSERSRQWVPLLTHEPDKVDLIPLTTMPVEGVSAPPDPDAKRALRERLGLPRDRFVFISPGFFFARKRYIEVIRALPPDAVLVLSGTRSDWEPRYFDEVMAVAKGRPNVIVNTDYDTMGDYVAASDCVVLFYEDVFQSAVVTQAVWAGLPCIFSPAEGFAPYHAAGIVVRDTGELVEAMRDIQRPDVYAKIVRSVGILRRLLSPERNAERYIAGVATKR